MINVWPVLGITKPLTDARFVVHKLMIEMLDNSLLLVATYLCFSLQECKCDKHGSKSNFCNYETGQCYCRTGYSGEKCNLCAAGYYGFPKCRPCSCNLAGSDPETCFDNHCLCDNSGNCYCKVSSLRTYD